MIKELSSTPRLGKPPVISIHKRGAVKFSVEAVKLLDLKEGDKIDFFIDTDFNDIAYFFKSDTGNQLKAYEKHKSGVRLTYLSRPVCRELIKHFGANEYKKFSVKKDTTTFNGREAWFITKY